MKLPVGEIMYRFGEKSMLTCLVYTSHEAVILALVPSNGLTDRREQRTKKGMSLTSQKKLKKNKWREKKKSSEKQQRE